MNPVDEARFLTPGGIDEQNFGSDLDGFFDLSGAEFEFECRRSKERHLSVFLTGDDSIHVLVLVHGHEYEQMLAIDLRSSDPGVRRS